MATELDKAIGSKLREARTLRGLTQEKLAEAIDITFQQVQKYEKGKNRISVSRLIDICAALDFPASFFVGEDKNTAPAIGDIERQILPSLRGIKQDQVKLVKNFAKILTQGNAKAAAEEMA